MSHPIVTLLLGSGVAAIWVAIVQVGWLAHVADVGRIREFDWLVAARLLFESRTDVNLPGLFPVIVNRPFELTAAVPFVSFLALAFAVMLVVFWIAALLLAPLVIVAWRAIPEGPGHRVGTWLWGCAYPLAIVVAFALPATLVPIRVNLVASQATILAATLTISVVAWGALLGLLRGRERIRNALRRSAWVASAVTSMVWVVAVVALALEPRPAQPAAAAGAPNVLLVSIDSLRHDHLHCYGYPRETSPTIDALAREGVLFETVVSPTSWTLPAHLTLLTALPPEQHGVTHGGARMGEEAVLLSEVLWQAGYTSAGFVSAPYLDAAYGYAQGFDLYDDYTIAKRSLPASHHGVTSPDLVRVVARWLDGWDRAGRRRPFFMFVHMWDVHYDYTPPPPYDSMFDPDYRGPITGENFQGPGVFRGMNPRDLEHIIALYDGEIRFTDLHLGHLVDHLRRIGILDRTIVVVTADHGDEFFEHGRKGHKQALYDETILVPLVIRYPAKVPQGARVGAQVRLMDIPLTVLALAGVDRPPGFAPAVGATAYTARDLTPWISRGSVALPTLVAFSDLIGDAPVPVASIRTETSKLIQEQKGAGNEELYDLVADPGEHANVSGARAEVGTALREELSTWRNGFAAARPVSRKAQLSDAHKERLRELGYGN